MTYYMVIAIESEAVCYDEAVVNIHLFLCYCHEMAGDSSVYVLPCVC